MQSLRNQCEDIRRISYHLTGTQRESLHSYRPIFDKARELGSTSHMSQLLLGLPILCYSHQPNGVAQSGMSHIGLCVEPNDSQGSPINC